MLNKLRKSNNNEGFTIIEVMIVLAIAGLIILIVLLAVPALQRNGRNTAIKNDAASIAGAISTYESDNDGKAPTTTAEIGVATPGVVTIGAAATSQSEAKIQGGTTVVPATAAPTAAITPGTINVVVKMRCDGTSSGRAVAVWYSIETAKAAPTTSPWNNKCVDA